MKGSTMNDNLNTLFKAYCEKFNVREKYQQDFKIQKIALQTIIHNHQTNTLFYCGKCMCIWLVDVVCFVGIIPITPFMIFYEKVYKQVKGFIRFKSLTKKHKKAIQELITTAPQRLAQIHKDQKSKTLNTNQMQSLSNEAEILKVILKIGKQKEKNQCIK